jgi:hypothetical protein
MEKEFIPYEQALALKELGFDEPCFGYYTNQSHLIIDEIASQQGSSEITSAPTWQSAFKWFRESDSISYEEAELECLKTLIEIVKSKIEK